jgi:hypothetical protein
MVNEFEISFSSSSCKSVTKCFRSRIDRTPVPCPVKSVGFDSEMWYVRRWLHVTANNAKNAKIVSDIFKKRNLAKAESLRFIIQRLGRVYVRENKQNLESRNCFF